MNCKSKIQYVLAVLLPLAAYAEVTAVAPTMVSSCYQIDSLANLRWVSENSSSWSSCFVQTKDIDASETSGWNSGAGFVSIGNNAINFTGSFNGKSHVIKGLAINRPTTDYVGLFGFLGHGAVVDSLSVRSASLTGQKQTGIIAGYNVGKIQHSNTSGTVTGSDGAGGLVGFDSAAIVTLCYSTATVNGALGVGGLVGNNVGKSVITQSYATGVVTGGTGASDYTAGGLVGFNATDDTIRNSYALGHVSGNAAVGGFVGSNYGVIEKGYSVGRVTTTATTGLVFGFTTNNNNIGKTTASFWDTSASGIDSSKGGSTRNTTQMQSQSTFTDSSWDFINTWAIVSGVNGGYPLLQALAYLPQVSTQAASGISRTLATANGTVTGIGSSDLLNHGFCWGRIPGDASYLIGSCVDLGARSDTGAFTGTLSGLSGNTTYFVRAYATNASGISYGDVVSFTTQKMETPTVSTSAMGSVSNTKAIANGNLTWLGSGITAHGFCWSLGASPGLSSNNCMNLGAASDTGAFSGTIAGLAKGTSYYVRAYATTDADTAYGSTMNFTTPTLIGSGTDADPYLVANYEDLEAVGVGTNSLSAVYRVTADIDASPSVTENSGAGFVPIGTFAGKFHGSGHVIFGLTVNRTTTDYVGLFGIIGFGGLVDSLGLEGGGAQGKYVVGNLAGENQGSIAGSYAMGSTFASVSDGSYATAGGLVGYNSAGTITGSYATGSASVSVSVGDATAGGLVGYNSGTITGCYATGSASASASASTASASNASAGGLVGENNHGGTITGSYATGSAFASATWAYAGGLGGNNVIGTIMGCYATGTATASPSATYVYTGGLVGANRGAITQSYWNTTTSAKSSGCKYNGGTCSAIGLTDTQMRQSTNLNSLDFINIWIQYNGHTYPMLRSFMTPLTVTAKDTAKTYDGTALTGGNGFAYSLSNVQTSLIHGTPIYGGSSQNITDTGSYAITVDSLWSTQQGYSITFANGTLRINPKPLTLTGLSVPNKVYDGTTLASITGTASLHGAVVNDDVSLSTGTIAANFANKNVGTAKTVTVRGYSLSGSKAGDYIIDTTAFSADITAKPLSIIGVTASNKVYDATNMATLTGGALDSAVNNDIISFTQGTGIFADNIVSSGKTVSATGYALAGADANNYSLRAQPTSITASITPKTISIAGAVAQNKTYDGTATAIVQGGALQGIIAGDSASFTLGAASFADNMAGTGKVVTVTSLLHGKDSANYALSAPTGLNADITPRSLTISTVAGSDKVYDGTNSATFASIITDKLTSDSLILSADSAWFADKNVGSGKLVLASGFRISGGADSNNYVLSQGQQKFTTANITPKIIHIAANADTITQGATNPALTYVADSLLAGDSLTGTLTREVGDTAGTYAILIGTLSAGGNYTIDFTSANVVITAPESIRTNAPSVAFTGRASATIFNLQGKQVWSGSLDVINGQVQMPSIGEGRWVVKLQMGTTKQQ